MAANQLAYLDLAIDNFSGTDPDQDAESFSQKNKRKINFAHSDEPGDFGELAFQEESAVLFLNPRIGR